MPALYRPHGGCVSDGVHTVRRRPLGRHSKPKEARWRRLPAQRTLAPHRSPGDTLGRCGAGVVPATKWQRCSSPHMRAETCSMIHPALDSCIHKPEDTSTAMRRRSSQWKAADVLPIGYVVTGSKRPRCPHLHACTDCSGVSTYPAGAWKLSAAVCHVRAMVTRAKAASSTCRNCRHSVASARKARRGAWGGGRLDRVLVACTRSWRHGVASAVKTRTDVCGNYGLASGAHASWEWVRIAESPPRHSHPSGSARCGWGTTGTRRPNPTRRGCAATATPARTGSTASQCGRWEAAPGWGTWNGSVRDCREPLV